MYAFQGEGVYKSMVLYACENDEKMDDPLDAIEIQNKKNSQNLLHKLWWIPSMKSDQSNRNNHFKGVVQTLIVITIYYLKFSKYIIIIYK